jgi:hypothetical protein
VRCFIKLVVQVAGHKRISTAVVTLGAAHLNIADYTRSDLEKTEKVSTVLPVFRGSFEMLQKFRLFLNGIMQLMVFSDENSSFFIDSAHTAQIVAAVTEKINRRVMQFIVQICLEFVFFTGGQSTKWNSASPDLREMEVILVCVHVVRHFVCNNS